jgi:hypothetical protein
LHASLSSPIEEEEEEPRNQFLPDVSYDHLSFPPLSFQSQSINTSADERRRRRKGGNKLLIIIFRKERKKEGRKERGKEGGLRTEIGLGRVQE